MTRKEAAHEEIGMSKYQGLIARDERKKREAAEALNDKLIAALADVIQYETQAINGSTGGEVMVARISGAFERARQLLKEVV